MNDNEQIFNENSDSDEDEMDLRKLVKKYQDVDVQLENYELTKELMEKIARQFTKSTSEQNDAIMNLRIYVPKGLVQPSFMPRNFVQTYVALFTSPMTDIYVKAALLSLSDDMMKFCIDFVDEFGKELYYSRVYEEMRRNNFHVEQCLPVLNHFLLHYSIAFTYLSSRGFIEFVIEKLQTEKSKSSIFSLYESMRCYTSSINFPPPNKNEIIAMLFDHCIKKIIPNKEEKTFIELETQILVPVVKTLSNLIIQFGNDPAYLNEIINQCVSIFILSIVNEENMELSIAGTDFLCSATYLSDEICLQLQKIDVVQSLSTSLLNQDFYSKCAIKCLRIIYNTFVACSNFNNETKSYIIFCSKNHNFLRVLSHAMEKGLVKEKNEAFAIIGTMLYFMEPDDAIALENEFKISEYLQALLDFDSCPQDIFNNLLIAQKLAKLSDLSPIYRKQLSDFREIMMSSDMVDSLQKISLNESDQALLVNVGQLLQWISYNSQEND